MINEWLTQPDPVENVLLDIVCKKCKCWAVSDSKYYWLCEECADLKREKEHSARAVNRRMRKHYSKRATNKLRADFMYNLDMAINRASDRWMKEDMTKLYK